MLRWNLNRFATPRRRGVSMIYFVLVLVIVFGFVALGVDVGRMHLAKTELQTAADAAARAATWHIVNSPSTAEAQATALAAANTCDSQNVALQPQDIEFGWWDFATRTFEVLDWPEIPSANAVRVHARRLASRGNALPLTFAPVIGINTADIQATAIAAITSGQRRLRYGIVGIDSVTMVGAPSPRADSYLSADGPYGGTNIRSNGDVLSNGSMNMTGKVVINGAAYVQEGQTVTGGTISGGVKYLDSPMEFEKVDASAFATTNDNANIVKYLDSSGNFSITKTPTQPVPGGTYYVHDFKVAGGATVTFSSPVIIYVAGSVDVSGNATTVSALNQAPGDLSIRVQGSGSVSWSGTAAMYADFYAPESSVSMTGTAEFFGSVVGLTLTTKGTPAIHYDESLNREVITPITVSLVQ